MNLLGLLKVDVSWMLLKGRSIMIVGNVRPQKRVTSCYSSEQLTTKSCFLPQALPKSTLVYSLPLCKKKKKKKKCGTLNQNLVNISYLCAVQTFNIIYFTDAVLHLLLRFWFSSSADETFCVCDTQISPNWGLRSWPTVRHSLNCRLSHVMLQRLHGPALAVLVRLIWILENKSWGITEKLTNKSFVL